MFRTISGCRVPGIRGVLCYEGSEGLPFAEGGGAAVFRRILSGCCVEKVLGSVSGPPGESIDWRHATPALGGLTGGRRASSACFWLDI